MKRLIKRIRLGLGLYNRAELIKFGFEILKYKKTKTYLEGEISHADVENFIHELKTTL